MPRLYHPRLLDNPNDKLHAEDYKV